MEAFTTLASVVVPLDRANVDTDAILPKQFMKSIRRTGFGEHLFHEWRQADPQFVLNQPRYAGARILLTRENFGCGSSREHAPWALRDWGIRALVAPSFADIFHGNCFKNGMLPIVLSADAVDRLFALAAAPGGLRLAIDLAAQTVTPEGGEPISFDVDSARKHRLLNGLDDIALTLAKADRIRAHEAQRRAEEPWLFH
jgi:3-isopropylmalate/(R)-2-methylmalate dehydratase small subunit